MTTVILTPAQKEFMRLATVSVDGNPFQFIGVRQMAGGSKRRMLDEMKKRGWFDDGNCITQAGREVQALGRYTVADEDTRRVGSLEQREQAIRDAKREPCQNCGERGAHFVPPSLGEPGFFTCDTGAIKITRAFTRTSGASTTSFPALKRTTSGPQLRLADDSGPATERDIMFRHFCDARDKCGAPISDEGIYQMVDAVISSYPIPPSREERLLAALKPFADLINDIDQDDPLPEGAGHIVHCLIMGEGELGDMPLDAWTTAAAVYKQIAG